MDNDTVEFIKALTLSNAELWEYKDHQNFLRAKGPLEVLFCKDLNLALFRLNKFRYGLDRTLKVIASSENENQFRSYLLPAGDSCHVLKLEVPTSDPSVSNFETIIENSCQLVRNPDLDTHLQSYKDKASGIFHQGENLAKQAYIRASSLVSKGIAAVIHRPHGENPNQTLVRKIEEIRATEKGDMGFETFVRNEAIELMEASNEFSKRQGEGFWNHFGETSQETGGTEGKNTFKNDNEAVDTSKTSADEKTRLPALNEKGHSLFEKAKETLSHLTHKAEPVEETAEYRESIGKVLKREDQVTDVSEMPDSAFQAFQTLEEKTRLQKLNEMGHALIDKAKQSLGHLTDKIYHNKEIKEDDKVFLRSDDHLTDIGQLPYLPIDEKSNLQKIGEVAQGVVEAAQGAIGTAVDTVASILPGQDESGKEETEKKEEEGKDKVEEVQEEKTPIIEQAKDLIRQASQKLEEYRDDGDLSSETTIQPNREGPSALDKANEVADKVVETMEEAVGVKTGEGESLTDKVKEKASELKDKISNSEENEGFKEIKTGFSETVEELRKERGEGEFRKQLHSKNPFENFAGEENLKENKRLDEKVKGSLGEKLTETKEKIKSVFVPDKENAPEATA